MICRVKNQKSEEKRDGNQPGGMRHNATPFPVRYGLAEREKIEGEIIPSSRIGNNQNQKFEGKDIETCWKRVE